MKRSGFLSALVALALLVAACGGDDEVAETTTTAAPTETTAAPVTTTSTAVSTSTAPATTTAAPTTTTEPPVVAPVPGSLLITNEDGVFVATPTGVVSQVLNADSTAVGGIVDFAIDDTRGGIIVQPHRGMGGYGGNDAIVYWAPEGSGALQELLVPAEDQSIKLEDVAANGDVVTVYYTRRSGYTPDTAQQTLRSFDLDAKTVDEIAVVGGWESGTSPISVGGNAIVRSGAGEAWFWTTFSDLAGTEFDSPANPMPDGAEDCIPDCFWYADLSPGGSQVAFGRLAPNAGGFPAIPEILVRNVATGDLVMDVTLPELSAGGYIDSLDVSATHVLINIVEEGAVFPYARVIEIGAGGTSAELAPIGGIARFLRSTPDLSGVLSWP